MPRSTEGLTGAGKRIREQRTRLGLTMEQLANKAGISKSFLWEVEQDRSDISGEKLLRVANALRASIDYLLKGSPAPADQKPSSVEIPAGLNEFAEELGLPYRTTVAILDVENSVWARRRDTRPERTKEYWRNVYEQVKPLLEDE